MKVLVGAFNQEKAFLLLRDCENQLWNGWTVLQHYYLLVYTKQSGYIIGTTTQHLENMKCDNFLFSLELIF